jgi:hypothetical protein
MQGVGKERGCPKVDQVGQKHGSDPVARTQGPTPTTPLPTLSYVIQVNPRTKPETHEITPVIFLTSVKELTISTRIQCFCGLRTAPPEQVWRVQPVEFATKPRQCQQDRVSSSGKPRAAQGLA